MSGERRRLHAGKIPIEVLDKTVLKYTGRPSKDIATPPKAGLDFAAVRVGEKYLLVSADPITGVSENIGEYAINVSANDVATSGNRPKFAETVVLLPEGSGKESVAAVASQMDRAARRLGIAIVGGHTEVTPSLERPIVMVTAFCVAERYVTSGDARPGDSIMMTKAAGLEGTAVLAGSPGVAGLGGGLLRRAGRFLSRISVVDEAVRAFRTGQVSAMHDCTEGGVLGGVYEMSLASGLGAVIDGGSVPVAPETRAICERLALDPLKLIASGSMLLSVRAGMEDRVREALGETAVGRIGTFTRRRKVLVRREGREIRLRSAPEDELWRALGRKHLRTG